MPVKPVPPETGDTAMTITPDADRSGATGERSVRLIPTRTQVTAGTPDLRR